MPITASAKKAARQNKTRRTRNLKLKATMKTAVKNFRKLVIAKKLDEAKALLPKVYQALDKTAKAGTIKKNTAARLKSRLMKSLAAKAK